AMTPQQQIALLKRRLMRVEAKTTHLAAAPWFNEVSVYTDPAHLARERQLLFRRLPLLMGFGSEWAGAGAFKTADYGGLPILIVPGRGPKMPALLNVCRHPAGQGSQSCGEDPGCAGPLPP